MRIKLYSISDSDKHFSSACDEYTKRLGKYITVHDLKPCKHGTQERIISSETQQLVGKLKSGYQTLVLNPLGDQLTTKQRHSMLWGKNSQLIIGGPYGLEYPMFNNAIHISLGMQTMPHGLAKLVFMEQAYRVRCIGQGKKYHY